MAETPEHPFNFSELNLTEGNEGHERLYALIRSTVSLAHRLDLLGEQHPCGLGEKKFASRLLDMAYRWESEIREKSANDDE